jgi:hypothetical protein
MVLPVLTELERESEYQQLEHKAKEREKGKKRPQSIEGVRLQA